MGRTLPASPAALNTLCSLLRGLSNILRQQEKSHLTSASGAKLTLRKHLLKEGREVLQGTEAPGPMPGGPHHETAPTQGLSFPIWTIKGLG